MEIKDILTGTYQRYIVADFLSTDFFNKRIPLVVDGVKGEQIPAVKAKILNCFGNVELGCVTEDGVKSIRAAELCEDIKADSIAVEGRPVTECERFDFADFVQIMKRLRADDGCEWDRAQTHESIRINLIEEAYELVEGIDCKDAEMMREECGDVLMQAVFHTEIAEKNGEFNYYDMLTNLCRKLIDRHTHIFGSNHADNPEEALKFWNEAKKKEKKYKSTSDAMDRVPKNLPALLYAEKVQKLAKKAGFFRNTEESTVGKLYEEIEELKTADEAHKFEEAGDLLFAAMKTVDFYGIEAEMALHEASLKFLRRFCCLEKLAEWDGKKVSDCSFEELERYWRQVKLQEET